MYIQNSQLLYNKDINYNTGDYLMDFRALKIEAKEALIGNRLML